MKKENLKNILMWLVVVVLIIAIIIVLIIKNTRNSVDIVGSDYRTSINKVDLDNVFSEIEKLYTNTNSEPQEIPTELSGEEFDKPQDNTEEKIDESKVIKGEEIKDYLDFGDLSNLEMGAYINTDDEHIDEVWIVKLDKMENQEKVARLLGNRIQRLRDGFSQKEYESKIANEAKVNQEDAVVIMIASPNQNEIEKIIAREMTK